MNKSSTVFILTAVRNHYEHTKKLLISIQEQSFKNTKTIVIDDGSSDDTVKNLKINFPSTKIINGDGNLWWTGAMELGVQEILARAKNNDYILTINNDCTFDKNYVENIVKLSLANPNSIINSVVIDKNSYLISEAEIKLSWTPWKFTPSTNIGKKLTHNNSKLLLKSDTLQTKGTLFPISVFKKIGNFDKKNLPHYMSDYELACRAKKYGYKLFVSYHCPVFNDTSRTGFGENFKNSINKIPIKELLFSRRSKINIIDQIQFIRLCCPWYLIPLNYAYLCYKILKNGFKFIISTNLK